MGRKSKPESKTATMDEPVKKADNITNIKDEIISLLGSEPIDGSYCLYVKKYVPQPNGNALWSYIGRITGDDMTDVQEKLLGYSPGAYRLEAHYEKTKKKVPGLPEFEVAVGDIQDTPKQSSLVHRDMPLMNRTPVPQSANPVESNPKVVEAKVNAEVVKSKIEEVTARNELKRIEGGDNMDANAIKVLELQNDKRISDVQNNFAVLVNSLSDKFTSKIDLLASSLEPSNNGEHSREIQALNEKISKLAGDNQTNTMMTMFMKTMENLSVQQNKTTEALASKQSQSEEKLQGLVLKMIEVTTGQKNSDATSLMNLFMKGVALGEDRLDRRAALSVGDETPEEPKSEFERIVGTLVDSIGQLHESGLLEKFLGKEQATATGTLTKEQLNALVRAEVQRRIDSGLIKINPAAQKTISAPAVPKPNPQPSATQPNPAPVATAPAPSEVDADIKDVVKKIVDTMFSQVKIRPLSKKWVNEAMDNLPEDMLTKIYEAANQLEIITLFTPYLDEAAQNQFNVLLADPKAMQWIMDGFNELRTKIEETLYEDEEEPEAEGPADGGVVPPANNN